MKTLVTARLTSRSSSLFSVLLSAVVLSLMFWFGTNMAVDALVGFIHHVHAEVRGQT